MPINIITTLAGSGMVGAITADWLKPSLMSVVAVDLVSPGVAPMPQVMMFANVYNVETGAMAVATGPVLLPGFGPGPVEVMV